MKSRIFLTVLNLIAVVSISAGISQAQTGEDYYNQRIQKLKRCNGDQECLRKLKQDSLKKRQETRDFLNKKGAGWNSSNWDAKGAGASDDEFAGMSRDELIQKLTDAKFFYELDQAKNALESPSHCGNHRKKAIETRDELDRLNQQIRNKTTENYGSKAQDAKDANTEAIRKYEDCYARGLPNYKRLAAKGVTTRNAHSSAYNSQVPFYDHVADLSEYIRRLEKALEEKNKGTAPDDVIAAITHVHNYVEVLPGGRGNRWEKASRGYKLRISDHIRTGSRSRARLEFKDYDVDLNAGPTVINMGSDSQVKMEKFVVSFKAFKREGIIDLIRGSLRAFTRNWGFKNSFIVRTGTSICGIRGTEVAVNYNPDTRKTDYHLDHGDAFVQAGGKQTALTPRTSRSLSSGVLSAARPLTAATWSKILTNTGNSMVEALTTASASSAELLGHTKGTTKPRILRHSQKMKRAEEMVGRYLDAMKRNDRALLLILVRGELEKEILLNTREQSLTEWLNQSRQRPMKSVVKCSLCDKDGETCQVKAHVQTEDDLFGEGADVLFTLREENKSLRIVASSKKAKDVSSFMLNSPVCRK